MESKFEIGDICVYRTGIGKIKQECVVKVVHDGGRGVYRVRRLGYPFNRDTDENSSQSYWWAMEDTLSKLE